MRQPPRILERAREDVQRIFDWLERRSPQGAVNWYVALVDAVERIAENPESYAITSEALPRWNREIHQALFKTPRGRRYRIIFELTETEIRILRVRGPGQPPLRGRDLSSE
jgi:plasmid stabilization system protein ParE